MRHIQLSMPRVRSLAPCLLIALIAMGLSGGGCGSGDAGSPATPANPEFSGHPDVPSNGVLKIDEKKLTGTAKDGKLLLSIPIQSLSSVPQQGTLNVALRIVDGSNTLNTTTAAYALPAGGEAISTAELLLPDSFAKQSELVRYVVRIDDGTPTGLVVTRSVRAVVPPYELLFDGPADIAKGKSAAWRVRAQNPVAHTPLPDMPVTLRLLLDNAVVDSRVLTTGPLGDAVYDFAPSGVGSFSIEASMAAQATQTQLQGAFAVHEPGPKVLLTSDKPIYQPGQVIHIRSLTLQREGNAPLVDQAAVFEVFDGKGNKIFKRSGKTDAYGIASTTFQLGSVLNQGDFKIKTTVADTAAEKTVKVAPYALPKFKADITTDKPWYLPGQTVDGLVKADYFFGKPVTVADVVIEASTLDVGETVFQKVQGKTDAEGRFPFQLTLPASLVGLPIEHGNALVNVRATVTDPAAQQVKKESVLVVSKDGLDLVLVPEATGIVPDIDNAMDLFASDPTGGPVIGASVSVAVPAGGPLLATTDEYGHATLQWNPGSTCTSGCQLTATVTPQNASAVGKTFSFGGQAGLEHVVVRTDKAIYGLGDTVVVEVRATPSTGHVYVDWINNGQTVDMRSLKVEAGAASFSASLDTSRLGANRIEAYVVDADGNVIRTGRTIFVRNSGSLSISLATDKQQYVPGEAAHLTFQVKDENGAPAVAALGVQIVDEAVFSLVDAQPGLLRTYFELEGAFSTPHYEIEGPPGDMNGLIFSETTSTDPAKAEAAQKKAAATLASLGDTIPSGLSLSSWTLVASESTQILQSYFPKEKQSLLPRLIKLAAEESKALAAAGCTPQKTSCNGGSSYYQLLSQAICARVSFWDFWGNPYQCAPSPYYYGVSIQLTTTGPDEVPGAGDDQIMTFSSWELQLDGSNGGYGGGASMDSGTGWSGAAGAGGGSMGGSSQGGAGGGTGNAEPRVRKFFPETLYVAPALITDPSGQAAVDLTMADSITRWRVSTLANSATGKLGGGLDGITVFQDFFVDIDFPASLTRGDELQFPIAIYNYLTTSQSVNLQLQAADWFTPLGLTSMTVDLGAGEVKGIRFPVRVDKVGLQTLTVKAIGSKASDAVARTVRVEPGGKAFPSSQSAALAAGEATHQVSFPVDAIPGSPRLHVNVFPAFLSQVVQGMDSLLQVPSGCFEQTTSTTWPNVLVSQYMSDTGQITPAIQMKADSMINAGYQRLLTFEHPGGGFSWFGTQDQAPNLSVTAFGLMEFADMAKVTTVDEAMIQRTSNWVAGQQKPDGSWEGQQTEFFSFNTSTVRNTAFVLWALQAAGYQGTAIDNAAAYLKPKAQEPGQDAYTLGIVANALQIVAPNDPATSSVFAQIEAAKKTDGKKVYWDTTGTQTDFYGSGQDSNVASTALIAHALILRGGGPSVNGALEYLLASRDPMGNFGSTQATIWTLRTLILAAAKGTEGAVGSLQVSLDGTPYSTLDLTASQSDVMSTVELGNAISTGPHDVKLSFVGTGKVSYHLVSGYNVDWANVPAEPPGPISVSLSYDKTTLALNEMVTATAHITNNTTTTQNMILVTLGIPPGFQVQTDDLSAYMTTGLLSNFELTGKQVTLYLTKLAASGSQDIEYRLLATMPVTASDGGGQAYPYYEPQSKTVLASTTFQVQ
ncbi:MAG: alpha-2-macroglobulin [Deltaproteobacteria bacterium]|nr:alpha-2-macroglobulin [Deltaproteobacteria bacterium]